MAPQHAQNNCVVAVANREKEHMAVRTTLESMGIWSDKTVSANLLFEDAHESYLFSYIAHLDYMASNLGCTHPQPLEGLPAHLCQ